MKLVTILLLCTWVFWQSSPNGWVVLGAFETEEQCRAANPLSVATGVEGQPEMALHTPQPSERPGEAVPLL